MAIIVTEFDGVEKGCIEQEFVATPVTLEPMDSDEITLNSEEITDINNQVVAQVHQLESLNAFELGEINKAFEALLVTESLYNEDLTQYQKEKRLAALESLDFSLPSMESNEEKEKGILTRIWEWIKNAFESFKKRMLKVGQWIKIQVKKMVRAIRGKNKNTITKLETLKKESDSDLVDFEVSKTLMTEVFFTKSVKEAKDLLECIQTQDKVFSQLTIACSMLRLHYGETYKKLKENTFDKIFTKEELATMIEKELGKLSSSAGSIKIEDGKIVVINDHNDYLFEDIPSEITDGNYKFKMSFDDMINLVKAIDASIVKLEDELDTVYVQTDRLIVSVAGELKEAEKYMQSFLKARRETLKDRNVGFSLDKEAVNHDRLVIKTRIILLQELSGAMAVDINNSNTYLLNPVVKYIGRLGKASEMIDKLVMQEVRNSVNKAVDLADKADSE